MGEICLRGACKQKKASDRVQQGARRCCSACMCGCAWGHSSCVSDCATQLNHTLLYVVEPDLIIFWIYIYIYLLYPLSPSSLFPCYLKCSLTAKAACSHVVELAQAEVAHNPRACQKVREFAAIRLSDAEVGVHKLFQRYELSAPIDVYNAEIARHFHT